MEDHGEEAENHPAVLAEHVGARLQCDAPLHCESAQAGIPHTHGFAQLLLVLSGQGVFEVDGRALRMRPGDLLIVNPDVEHSERCVGEEPLDYIMLGVDRLAFSFDADSTPFGCLENNIQSARLRFYFQEILREMQEKGLHSERIASDLLEALLLTVVRDTGFVSAAYEPARSSRESGAVKRYLDANYGQEITLDLLAQRTNLNKYYLVHAFTRAHGVSPINYLISRRIEAAKHLLESSDQSIAQIAATVGFSSQSYFSQSFRRLVSCTPAQYRKQARRAQNSRLAAN